MRLKSVLLAAAFGVATASSFADEGSFDEFKFKNAQNEFKHDDDRDKQDDSLRQYKHIVIIYQENHSFDNLYGLWGKVGQDMVDGQPDADKDHTIQVRQDNHTP